MNSEEDEKMGRNQVQQERKEETDINTKSAHSPYIFM